MQERRVRPEHARQPSQTKIAYRGKKIKETRVRPEQARKPYQQQEKLKLRIKQNLYLRREEKAGIDHERGMFRNLYGIQRCIHGDG